MSSSQWLGDLQGAEYGLPAQTWTCLSPTNYPRRVDSQQAANEHMLALYLPLMAADRALLVTVCVYGGVCCVSITPCMLPVFSLLLCVWGRVHVLESVLHLACLLLLAKFFNARRSAWRDPSPALGVAAQSPADIPVEQLKGPAHPSQNALFQVTMPSVPETVSNSSATSCSTDLKQ